MRVRYIPSAIYCYCSDGQVVEYGLKKEFKFKSVKDEKLEEDGFKDFLDEIK